MRKRGFWLMLAFFAFLLVGCGTREKTPTAPRKRILLRAPAITPSGAEAITGEELDKIGKAKKTYKLALVVKTRNNPFFDPMIKAAEAEAKNLGVAPLDVQSPAQEGDKERQFAIVQDVTAKGVDAILIAPADSKGIVPALKQAQDKGILVVNVDNRVDKPTAEAQGLRLGGYVGADNEQGGRLAGEAMVKALSGKRGNRGNVGNVGNAGGRSKVAVLEGIRGADNAEARKRGFTSAVQGKLEVAATDSAEWDTQKAYAKFQSMLAAHRDLNGLFCANDKMALGALKAIQEAGRKGSITVVGYDNIPDVKPYLQSGEMFATIEQHPDLMGKYGVKMAVGILDGSLAKGREFLVPLEVIGKDGKPMS